MTYTENERLHHVMKAVTAVDEFDFAERIKPSAILEYFQDLATVHAEEIGIGFETMKERNLCWVLNRLSAVIDRQPEIGEEITLATYPHKPGIADAVRDYYITDSKGRSLIRGTSRWCVLDIQNKAIRRCAALFDYPESAYTTRSAVEGGNPQICDISQSAGDSESASRGKVNITDLDRNGHMNNARYADMAVNAVDYDFYSAHAIKAFDFNFLVEMKIGEEYSVRIKTAGSESHIQAESAKKNKAVFRAFIQWDRD